MQIIIQRVDSAAVTVEGSVCGKIGKGLFILVGVFADDTEEDAEILAQKAAKLRVFCDENDKMNLSLLDMGYGTLAVSNFTLCADTKKGNRPSYINAMEPQKADKLYNYFMDKLRAAGVKQVEHGIFGAEMFIETHLNGPITVTLDSRMWRK